MTEGNIAWVVRLFKSIYFLYILNFYSSINTKRSHKHVVLLEKDSLEFDGQRDGVEENVDLEDAEEEKAEMFKHLGKEIPEEADVRSEVWYWETEGRETTKSQTGTHILEISMKS